MFYFPAPGREKPCGRKNAPTAASAFTALSVAFGMAGAKGATAPDHHPVVTLDYHYPLRNSRMMMHCLLSLLLLLLLLPLLLFPTVRHRPPAVKTPETDNYGSMHKINASSGTLLFLTIAYGYPIHLLMVAQIHRSLLLNSLASGKGPRRSASPSAPQSGGVPPPPRSDRQRKYVQFVPMSQNKM